METSEKSRNINYNARLGCQKTLKNSGFWHLCANYIRRVILKLNYGKRSGKSDFFLFDKHMLNNPPKMVHRSTEKKGGVKE